MSARLWPIGFAACLLLAPARATAEPAPPAAHDDDAFSFMSLLSQYGLHDIENERWNVYGQFTYLTNFKVPWHAPYTNANGSVNSFNTNYERSYTGTFSLFFGARLWPGGEVYIEPDEIAERPLSLLRGLGGVTENFELQKTGTTAPLFYRARLFLRQTFDLGGEPLRQKSQPLQLGTTVSRRRLVLTLGNISMLDVFTKNNVTGDPRQTFFNEAFMTDSAYDFPADARGFTVAAVAELYWDDWVLRLGRGAPPKNPNEQSLQFRFWQYYDDSLELEHDHSINGRPGAVRLLAYRSRIFSGRFDDAIAAYQADPRKNAADCPSTSYNYGSRNFTAPDFCWVRRTNVKLGIGINLDQLVAKDVGVFAKAMYADGQSEVDAYDSADASLSFGAVARGSLWGRPFDVAGIGFETSFITKIHAKFLAMGGVDGFVGDGHLRQAPEGLFEVFYSVNLLKAMWLAADYQLIWNPGYNADRPGPIHIPGVKFHAEF
jgi:high affinity Mn2+ porin